MTAPFAAELCGYRPTGQPNTSDATERFSVEIGEALFEHLGVQAGQPAVTVSKVWASAMSDDLQERLHVPAPHLVVRAEGKLLDYEQYAHLKVARDLGADDGREVAESLSTLDAAAAANPLFAGDELLQAVQSVRATVAAAEERRKLLLDLMADESPLNLDLAVERPTVVAPGATTTVPPHLVAGFSLKWSLRTDRLQDPRTQGSQMAAMRRGRMPHFAAVTMEPRPYFLGRLAMGTGDLDCVYHLALPELTKAVEDVCTGPKRAKQRETFRRLVEQRRLRDYDELVAYVSTL